MLQRTGGPKDAVINEIIAREWAMFQNTQNIGGRASCQNQYDTFYANRYSQFSVFQPDTLESYRQDLMAAEAQGRNLITEKYAYMMEFTEPAYYEANLRAHLPVLDQEKAALIAQIVARQLDGYQRYASRYPAMARSGRPEAEGMGDTSIRQYSIGELKTYSAQTLRLYLRDVMASENSVLQIQQMLVSFYGFASLEEAEAAQQRSFA